MDRKLLESFSKSVVNVLEQFGITGLVEKEMQTKDEMLIESEFTAFVGLVGNIQGNIAYCYSIDTAKQLASIMMMGMPIDDINDMVRSALAELSNMFAGTSASLLENKNISMEITPPSVVVGKDMYFILSFHEAYSVVLQSPIGEIEVNISLEI